MKTESATEEYLSILQDTRERLRYLAEVGVESIEGVSHNERSGSSRVIPRAASSATTPAATRGAKGIPGAGHAQVHDLFADARVNKQQSTDALFDDLSIPPPRLEKSSETFEAIWADIGTCTRCPLYERRTHIVHTEGNRAARLMFVGEAPGADEDAQARPFVGRAGQLLTKIIEAIGFKREEVLIGNVNRCRPPGNRPPTEQEVSSCKPFLLREIASVQPEVIVVLGNTATRNLLDTKIGITRLRGEFQEYQGVKVMPTFHPAYLLRDPSKKKETWEDLKKVRDYLDSTPRRES
jgi:DNA polymerase